MVLSQCSKRDLHKQNSCILSFHLFSCSLAFKRFPCARRRQDRVANTLPHPTHKQQKKGRARQIYRRLIRNSDGVKKKKKSEKQKKENFSTYSERDSFEKPKSEEKRELKKNSNLVSSKSSRPNH